MSFLFWRYLEYVYIKIGNQFIKQISLLTKLLLVFTALTSYGAFWLSFAAINIPTFGILAAYQKDMTQLSSALAFYLIAWAILSFIFMLLTFKSTVLLSGFFLCLTALFSLLSASYFVGSVALTKAAGAFGVIAVVAALYDTFALLATKQNSYFTLPVIPLPGSEAKQEKWQRMRAGKRFIWISFIFLFFFNNFFNIYNH